MCAPHHPVLVIVVQAPGQRSAPRLQRSPSPLLTAQPGPCRACTRSAASKYCWDPHGPNTGVILVRNTPTAFEMLEEWALSRREGGLCDEKNHIVKRDQARNPRRPLGPLLVCECRPACNVAGDFTAVPALSAPSSSSRAWSAGSIGAELCPAVSAYVF